MKAKRLTALALAALMAVSSATVALADPTTTAKVDKGDGALEFAGGYYKYDDDEGALVKAEKDDFKPGDTIYIPLGYTGPELTRDDTFYVKADIDIGQKWVDDVKFDYRKGEIVTTKSWDYSYNAGGISGSGNTGSTKNEQTVINEAKNKITEDTQMVKDYIAANYDRKENGYKFSNKYYADVKSVFDAAWVTTGAASTTYSFEGQDYTGASVADVENHFALKTFEAGKGAFDYNGLYYGNAKLLLEVGLLEIPVTGETKDSRLNTDQKIYVDSLLKDADAGTYNSSPEYQNNDNTDGKVSREGVSTFAYNGITYFYVPGHETDVIDVIKKQNQQNASLNIQSADDKASGYYYVDAGSSLIGTDGIKAGSFVSRNKIIANQSNGTIYYRNGEPLKSSEGKDVTTEEGALLAIGAEKVTASSPVYVKKATTRADNGVNIVADADVNTDAVTAVKNNLKASDLNIKWTERTNTDRRYTYWVRIDTDKSYTTKDIDVVGTIYVSTHSSLNSAKKDYSDKFNLDVTLTNFNQGPDKEDYIDVDSDVTVYPGERAVVTFADDADDVVIEFGDDAWYEFNARGQGRVNFAYNTNFDRDFAYDYDHANIDFINFVAEPTTNKTGTLYIYADEDSYIYEVTSKGAKKINGAYYDDDEGAWVIRTRHLTSYAISDRRLKTIDQMEDDKNSSSSSKPSGSQGSGSGNGNYKPIPDTGR